MSARDLFGLGVRLVGLWLLVEFVQAVPTILSTLLRIVGQLLTFKVGSFFDSLMSIVSLLIKPVVGFYCIKGAPHLTELAYPDKPATGTAGTLP
jgi:hypothetical protein